MPDDNGAVEDRPSSTRPVSEEHTENIESERTTTQRRPTQNAEDGVVRHRMSDAEAALRAIRSSSHHIIDLFLPVTLCMVIVVATIKSVSSVSKPKASNITSLIFGAEASGKSDTGTALWHGFAIVLIIFGVAVVMTILLVTLYIYRFYKILKGFLFLSSVVLLFFFCFIYLLDVLTNYNKAMDFMTLGMVIWNYGVVGLIAIHFSGPILLQQAYLIFNSALLAITFIKFLPDWGVWLLLAVMSIWDLIAVLCPMGPLRILVETAQQRQEPLFPSLVYSTRTIWFYGVSEEEETQVEGYRKPEADERDEKTKQLASVSPTLISSFDLKKTERWKSSVTEGHSSENSASDANSQGR